MKKDLISLLKNKNLNYYEEYNIQNIQKENLSQVQKKSLKEIIKNLEFKKYSTTLINRSNWIGKNFARRNIS